FSSTDIAPPQLYTLSLHDALPIYSARISCCLASSREKTTTFAGFPSSPERSRRTSARPSEPVPPVTRMCLPSSIGDPFIHPRFQDRKSTRLNSSHLGISYAVFCLK